ncbi:hypothetical protein GF325_09675 [Candidatus Bathyarchaeota archaeon]|nr:hypothetical protein [Candidatus Bathyarchaeota archaeon]
MLGYDFSKTVIGASIMVNKRVTRGYLLCILPTLFLLAGLPFTFTTTQGVQGESWIINEDKYFHNFPKDVPVVSGMVQDDFVDGYAVVCGVSDYPGTVNDLEYCDDDCLEVAAMVKNTFKIPEEHMLRFIDDNATKGAIITAITNFSSLMDENDYLFLFFSGHGSCNLSTSIHSWIAESPHPYPDYYSNYFHYSVPGADMMRVHFTRVETEQDVDIVWVGDYHETDYYYDYITGKETDYWSAWVPTDDIYVQLDADFSITKWGFKVDKVEVGYYASPHELIPHNGLEIGIQGGYLDQVLDQVPGKVVAAFDSCHSGGVGSEIAGPNRYIMTASQGDEFSLEDSERNNGLFSYSFLNGFYPSRDYNNDGAVSFEEAFDYIRPTVISRSTQLEYTHHPMEFDDITGETIIQPNAGIISISVGGSKNLSISAYVSGMGLGQMTTAYYNTTSQEYAIQYANNSILPLTRDGFYLLEVDEPAGFDPDAAKVILNNHYRSFTESETRELNWGYTFSALNDADGDTLDDYLEFSLGSNPWENDSDGDGLTDSEEYSYGFHPGVNDMDCDYDMDFMTNQWEIANGFDPQQCNLYTDADGDGLGDGYEHAIGSNILDPDTDGDGMGDYWEFLHSPYVNIFNPNDIFIDADGDTISNLVECQLGMDPGCTDSDHDFMPDLFEYMNGLEGAIDDSNMDLDGDGLSNYFEYNVGTNPSNKDTDGDWLNDLREIEQGTDPGNRDSDGDGFWDGVEFGLGNDPLSKADSPLLHVIAAILLVCIPILFIKLASRNGEKKPFKRPLIPGPRPKHKSRIQKRAPLSPTSYLKRSFVVSSYQQLKPKSRTAFCIKCGGKIMEGKCINCGYTPKGGFI